MCSFPGNKFYGNKNRSISRMELESRSVNEISRRQKQWDIEIMKHKRDIYVFSTFHKKFQFSSSRSFHLLEHFYYSLITFDLCSDFYFRQSSEDKFRTVLRRLNSKCGHLNIYTAVILKWLALNIKVST